MSYPSKSKTYVLNGTEVKLTGRVAEKQLRKGKDELYEVQPADFENGSWKKWVRLIELYEIKQSELLKTMEGE